MRCKVHRKKCPLSPPKKSHYTWLTSSSMERNYSASSFLRLPPEIRLQIYNLVLGGQTLFITQDWPDFKDGEEPVYSTSPRTETTKELPMLYSWGKFQTKLAAKHDNNVRSEDNYHVGLLRVCRQIYTETSLLPFQLNAFEFADSYVARLFYGCARPGKIRAMKKAIRNSNRLAKIEVW